MTDEKTIIATDINVTTLQPAQARNRACIVRYNGSDIGKRYILDEHIMVLGRDPKASQVHINDPTISRQHARFTVSDQNIKLEDLGTTNGTFINDRRITKPEVLQDSDMIRLGTVLLKYFSKGNTENIFHDKIYKKATTDPTTDIFNKLYLMESLESEFKISRNYKKPMSLIMYDIDFFKQINDNYGHAAGDIVLKQGAAVARRCIRKSDILARYGGEEFVIVLPDTDLFLAQEMAERIRASLENHEYEVKGAKIRATVSLGVAQIEPQMTKVSELLESADRKLYQSKRGGRNRVTA